MKKTLSSIMASVLLLTSVVMPVSAADEVVDGPVVDGPVVEEPVVPDVPVEPEVLDGASLLEMADMYLTFEDGSIADLTGNYNVSTMDENFGTPAPVFAGGKYGSAIQTSSNSFLTVEDLELGSDSYTISTWFNIRSHRNDPVLFGNKNWSSGRNQGMVVAYDGSNIVVNAVANNARVDQNISAYNVLNNWMYLTVVVDREAGTQTVYINGYSRGSEDISAWEEESLDSGYSFNIGNDGTGMYNGGNLTVLFDEFAFFKAALSDEEVKNLYNYTPATNAGLFDKVCDKIDAIAIKGDSVYDTMIRYAGACIGATSETYIADAEGFDHILKKEFGLNSEDIEKIRESKYLEFDADSQIYTISCPLAAESIQPEREYFGYIKNGDTYDVYYRHITFKSIYDVLEKEGKTLEDIVEDPENLPNYIVHNGMVFSANYGYATIVSRDNFGVVYTVEKNGSSVRVLSVREYTKEDLVDKTPLIYHGHDIVNFVHTETHDTNGYTEYICKSCLDYQIKNIVPAGHHWDFGTVVNNPTETEAGTIVYYCYSCDETRTEKVPALGSLTTYFSNRLAWLDRDGGLIYPWFIVEHVSDYFTDMSNSYLNPALVPAWEYESVLRKHFVIDDITLSQIRSITSYNSESDTYSLTYLGGRGYGTLHDREYLGYIANEDGTYDVFFNHINIKSLDKEIITSLLGEGASDGPAYLMYDGVVYVHSPYGTGYNTRVGIDNYGMKYTVEINGDVMRFISSEAYSAEDLPEKFDDNGSHKHTYDTKGLIRQGCDKVSYVVKACSCCTALIEKEIPADHFWDIGTVTVQPTETEGGEIVYTCSSCKETRTEKLEALGSYEALFKNVVGGFDYFNDGDLWSKAYYMANTVAKHYIDYSKVNAENVKNVIYVTAAEYEAVLDKYYNADFEVRYYIRNSSLVEYYPSTQTYGVKYIGGLGGMLPEREYARYAENEDGTYFVYYRTIPYQYLDDVLAADGKTMDDVTVDEAAGTAEYNGVIYTGSPSGYITILENVDESGIKYKVEFNGDVVRIISFIAYAEDHTHKWTSWTASDTENVYERSCVCGAHETWEIPAEENEKLEDVNKSDNEENTADVKLTNSGFELINNVLSDEEQSAIASGELDPADVKVVPKSEIYTPEMVEQKVDEEVRENIQEQIENVISSTENAVEREVEIVYLDLSLEKVIGENSEGIPVTNTNAAVTFTIDVPAEIAAENRQYFIVRSHYNAEDDKMEYDVLYDEDDDPNTITFSTDRFSVYALTYAETEPEIEEEVFFIPHFSYINIEDSENGSVKSRSKIQIHGLRVDLTVKPDEGYELESITVTVKGTNKKVKVTLKNGKYTFIMPTSNVVVEANFKEA
ncbi:MAG: LamG domain-containing protein [Ruminococcaceae bacterium]|nr:LamG domain-containing protein [Oscillospiraceae bacterium]